MFFRFIALLLSLFLIFNCNSADLTSFNKKLSLDITKELKKHNISGGAKIIGIGNKSLSYYGVKEGFIVVKINKKSVTANDDVFVTLTDKVNQASNQYNQNNIVFHQENNKLNSITQALNYKQNQLLTNQEQIGKNKHILESSSGSIKENREKLQLLDSELLSGYENKESFEKEVSSNPDVAPKLDIPILKYFWQANPLFSSNRNSIPRFLRRVKALENFTDVVPGWTEAIVKHNQMIFSDPAFDAFINPTRDGVIVARTDSLGAGLTQKLPVSKEKGEGSRSQRERLAV